MKKFSFILFLFISIPLFAENSASYYVKVKVDKKPIREVLAQIETQIDFTFSYNTRLINADSIVSYSSSGTLKKVISELFNKRIQAKAVGNYMVLIQSKKEERREENKGPETRLFTGTVINGLTNKPIENASVYALFSGESVLSDGAGNFEISISVVGEKSFAIAKKGYKETLVSVDFETPANSVVKLKPLSQKLSAISNENKDIKLVESAIIIPKLVPNESLINAENLRNVHEKKLWQVSFIPKLGTNLGASGAIDNQFSLNILGGFNGGVEGVELAGLFNVVKNDVWGFQVAGLTNVIGGKVEGIQVGGIGNFVSGDFTGLQVAGIYNHTSKKVFGLQAGGILNWSHDSLSGVQIAGITNISSKYLRGVQIAGINNKCKNNMSGAQFSCIKNKVEGKMTGAQIALINNAKHNNGLQFGLVNIADTATGVAIGLFSYVKTGYHPIELFGNEVLYANAAFKTGSDFFYTIYTAGLRPYESDVFGIGVGIGTKINTWKWLSISIDATTTYVNEYELNEAEYLELNQLNRLDLTLDFTLGKFSLIVGPAMNFHVSQLGYTETSNFTTNIASNPFYTEVVDQVQLQAWVGGKLGLRYSF